MPSAAQKSMFCINMGYPWARRGFLLYCGKYKIMTWAGWRGQGGERELHQAYKNEPSAVMEGLCLDYCRESDRCHFDWQGSYEVKWTQGQKTETNRRRDG